MQRATFLLSVTYSNITFCIFNLKITVGRSGAWAPSTGAREIYEYLFNDFLRFAEFWTLNYQF